MLKTICAHTKAFLLTQVEVALAYKCENNLTRRDLLQYVHRNRDNNARRINTMGEAFDIMFIAQRLGLESVHTLKNINILAQEKVLTRRLSRMRNLKSKRGEQRLRW